MTKIGKPLQPLARPGKAAKEQPTPEDLQQRIIQLAASKRTEIAQAVAVSACHGAGDALKEADAAAIIDGAFAIADAFILKAYNVKFNNTHAEEKQGTGSDAPGK